MKKFSLLLTALSALAVTLSACGASPAASSEGSSAENASASQPKESVASADTSDTGAERPPYHSISAEDAKKMMEEGGVTIVDVRTPKEYEEKHVKDAINIPVETISDDQPEALPDTKAAILVYCRTGVRAARASKALAEMGYENVYNFGGIVDWPYETE